MRAPLTDLPIRFERVGLAVGAVTLLRDIDLILPQGPPTALIGPNGSGKSTLLRLAMGLIAPSAGRITWGGRPDAPLDRRAMVFQHPAMLRRSVAANVSYALAAAGKSRDRRADAVAALLAQVGLAPLADRPATRLSGGERQRLALARALAREPEALFLDEPTASLDPAATRAVEDIVADAAARGVTVVMATHDLGQARRLAGRIVLLVSGHAAEIADAASFFARPSTPEGRAFLAGDIVLTEQP